MAGQSTSSDASHPTGEGTISTKPYVRQRRRRRLQHERTRNLRSCHAREQLVPNNNESTERAAEDNVHESIRSTTTYGLVYEFVQNMQLPAPPPPSDYHSYTDRCTYIMDNSASHTHTSN